MRVESPRTRRDLRSLGANLAASRKIHGLTQQELADRAGITRATLASLEHGEGGPRVEALLAVARVLGSNDALVGATDRWSPSTDERMLGAQSASGSEHDARDPDARGPTLRLTRTRAIWSSTRTSVARWWPPRSGTGRPGSRIRTPTH